MNHTITHIHLNEVSSTQTEIIDLLNKQQIFHPALISTSNQTYGFGRNNSRWIDRDFSLAFSFTIRPDSNISTIPLKIGLFITLFFKEQFDTQLYLKWPNDILNAKNEKCGGILCQMISKDLIVAGVGLNLFFHEEINQTIKILKDKNQNPFTAGHIFDKTDQLENNYKSQLPLQLVEYINSTQMHNDDILQRWTQNCIHHNKSVEIKNEFTSVKGIFTGVGVSGEALIQDNSTKKITPCFCGSLRFS